MTHINIYGHRIKIKEISGWRLVTGRDWTYAVIDMRSKKSYKFAIVPIKQEDVHSNPQIYANENINAAVAIMDFIDNVFTKKNPTPNYSPTPATGCKLITRYLVMDID